MTALLRRYRTDDPPDTSGGGGGGPTVAATWSDLMAESFGVCIHPTFLANDRGTNAYSNNGPNYPALTGEVPGQRAIREAVAELKVRWTRGDAGLNNDRSAAIFGDFATLGIRFCSTLPALPTVAKVDAVTVANMQAKTTTLLADAAANWPTVLGAVEGVNEPNLTGGGGGYTKPSSSRNWWEDARAVQADAFAKVNASVFAALPVLTPAVGGMSGYAQLGNLTASSDLGADHHYPGGNPPSQKIDAALANTQVSVRPGPLWTTETGYHNGLKSTATHFPTPEDVAGVYGPRIILDNYRRPDVDKVFCYEFVDQHRNDALDYHEDHFGLCAFDKQATPSWRRKPIFHSIRRLLTLCSDTTPAERTAGTTYSPAALGLVISRPGGLPTDFRSVLLGKRGGSYLLCLWRDVSIWTPAKGAGTAKTVSPVTVTITLGTSKTVAHHHLSTQDAPVSTATGTGHTVNLAAETVVLAIS